MNLNTPRTDKNQLRLLTSKTSEAITDVPTCWQVGHIDSRGTGETKGGETRRERGRGYTAGVTDANSNLYLYPETP